MRHVAASGGTIPQNWESWTVIPSAVWEMNLNRNWKTIPFWFLNDSYSQFQFLENIPEWPRNWNHNSLEIGIVSALVPVTGTTFNTLMAVGWGRSSFTAQTHLNRMVLGSSPSGAPTLGIVASLVSLCSAQLSPSMLHDVLVTCAKSIHCRLMIIALWKENKII